MKIAERDIIERIRKMSPETGKKPVLGIGDDCAVITLDNGIVELLSTDTLVEDIHFGEWHPPELLGRKAAAVNLSDVAAMGGVPKYCLLSLALSDQTEDVWLDKFISGFLGMLSEHDVELVGGDTVRSPDVTMLSVTVIGHSDEGGVLKRSGANIGDIVMTSGTLGNAAAGLELCRVGKFEKAAKKWPELLKAHLDPDPEISLGRFLSETGCVNAMMDMSDGLATDLAHICKESECAAEIYADQIPISKSLVNAVNELGLDPKKIAISGGEDYLLLFTVSAKHVEELIQIAREKLGRGFHKVGEIIQGKGVALIDGEERVDISYQGYDHFN